MGLYGVHMKFADNLELLEHCKLAKFWNLNSDLGDLKPGASATWLRHNSIGFWQGMWIPGIKLRGNEY